MRSVARKAYFNEAAKDWDEKYYTSELVAHLEMLVPKFGLKPGQSVLDAGTGTGVLIPFLLKAIGPSGSITAIDYAENMIERFRTKFSQRAHRRELPAAQDALPKESAMRQLLNDTGFGVEQITDNSDSYLCIATKY